MRNYVVMRKNYANMKVRAAIRRSRVEYSVMIPFTNDLDLLDIHTRWFEYLGRPFKALIDSKFQDVDQAKLFLKNRKISDVFENPGKIIETGYESFVSCSETNWLLRLDSDEIAPKSLFDFLDKNLSGMNDDWIVGIPRFQIVMINKRFYCLMSDDFIPEKHIQYRFVNKFSRKFGMDAPHNPGFLFDETKKIIAPLNCGIYHLDFLVRSQATRELKSATYDSLGQGKHMRNIQLGTIGEARFIPIFDEEILNFLNANSDIFYEWRLNDS